MTIISQATSGQAFLRREEDVERKKKKERKKGEIEKKKEKRGDSRKLGMTSAGESGERDRVSVNDRTSFYKRAFCSPSSPCADYGTR